MKDNVSVSFNVTPGTKVEDLVKVLSSLGVKVNESSEQNIVGEVYFTKVTQLDKIDGVDSVTVLGDVVPVAPVSNPVVVPVAEVVNPVVVSDGQPQVASPVPVVVAPERPKQVK